MKIRNSNTNTKRFLYFFFALLFVGLNVWAFQAFFHQKHGSSSFFAAFRDNAAAANMEQEENAPISGDAAGALNQAMPTVKEASASSQMHFQATSFYSMEFGEKGERMLFKIDEKKRLPIASLTKLMAALVVFNHYKLDQQVVISGDAMRIEGDMGSLKAGEALSVKNLLYIALIESSNRAVYALSEVVGPAQFVALMNTEAQNLGLLNTHFAESTGLSAASYSSAEDIGMLSQYLFLNYPVFREIVSHREFDLYLDNGTFHHKLVNTNKFLGEIEDVIGGKTGWTAEAKGCLMVIQQGPTPDSFRINVILGAQDRFLEMQKLLDWLRSHNEI